jgi:hypothetical protein
MPEQARPLPVREPRGGVSSRDRVARCRVAHLDQPEQTRQRRQPPVDGPRRITRAAPIADREHVAAMLMRQHLRAARPQVAQQDIGVDGCDAELLGGHPPREVQQVIGVGTHRQGCVVAIDEVPQELVDQLDPVEPVADQHPRLVGPLDPQTVTLAVHTRRTIRPAGHDPRPIDTHACAASPLATARFEATHASRFPNSPAERPAASRTSESGSARALPPRSLAG